MRILGVDPGIGRCGWCVLEKKGNSATIIDSGLIETFPSATFPERLHTVALKIAEVMDRHLPGTIAVEEIFFSKNAKTAIAVSHVRGVIINLAVEKKIAVREYTPLEIKMAVTGYGRADKQQVGKMIQALLKGEAVPEQDDVVDAVAVALCEMNTMKICLPKE